MPALAACGTARVVAVGTFNVHKIETPTFAPASSIAKAALETMVICFVRQLAPGGTTVNAVVLGFIRKDPSKTGALSHEARIQAAHRTPHRAPERDR
jgi:NAD(P)-dependent dehydrogenase (short-subunit alcohol dehydrogenase family)